MKNFLTTFALIAVITGGGAVAYYYGFYLPQKDAQAQAVILQQSNPTPEQVQAQKQADINALHAEDAKMNAYSKCMDDDTKAMNAYVESKCPLNNNDFVKQMDCKQTALASFTFKDCREELF